jgi:hypothetical protein
LPLTAKRERATGAAQQWKPGLYVLHIYGLLFYVDIYTVYCNRARGDGA